MKNSIDRRQSLAMVTAALIGTTLAEVALAAPPPTPSGEISGKPYASINPPVADDRTRIRLLFSYDCPHCRTYHTGLSQWGSTLPTPLKFDASPLITSTENDNQLLAIYGRLIAQAVAPATVKVYDYTMYAMVQGDSETGMAPTATITTDDIIRTLVNCGVKFKAMQAYVKANGPKLEKRAADHASLIKTYGVTVTPSVALVGRYLVTPDHANSNPQQYLLLLNGLVSRIIQGGANAL